MRWCFPAVGKKMYLVLSVGRFSLLYCFFHGFQGLSLELCMHVVAVVVADVAGFLSLIVCLAADLFFKNRIFFKIWSSCAVAALPCH